ncbi:MAG: hypothetical protein KGI75_03690 [Rhizobiaceae bacterium]|nr:hypothetical protein [Rhizobiaceae bacterium]
MNSTVKEPARNLTAFFDRRSDAEHAIDKLIDAGISNDAINITPGNESDQPEKGHLDFLDILSRSFYFSDEERGLYAEGLRRGGYLLTVRETSQEQHDKALKILAENGSIDLDERAEDWRKDGWIGNAG